MEIQLKRLRSAKGLSQEAMAEKLGIKTSRYGTWERGERMLSLAQAYDCAVILGCTIDEIAGFKSNDGRYSDPRQAELNAHFESFNDEARSDVLKMVDRMAHDPSVRAEKDGAQHMGAASA